MRKADGAYLYGTTDLAALKHRLQEEGRDWLIYVTDIGQASHFELVVGATQKAGFLPAAGTSGGPQINHVGFGLVLGAGGKRIRTRDGGDVSLALFQPRFPPSLQRKTALVGIQSENESHDRPAKFSSHI